MLELSGAPTTDLFAEMDQIADELRSNPQHVELDDQIAFRQLQRLRLPDLTKEQWLDLFGLWREPITRGGRPRPPRCMRV